MPDNDLNNLDEQLRQKFEDFGSFPSGKVWENIAAGVAQENRRKRRYWLWFSMAALLLMISGTTAWLLLKENRNGQSQTISEQVVLKQPVSDRTIVSNRTSGKNMPETTGFEKADEPENDGNANEEKTIAGNTVVTNQPNKPEAINTLSENSSSFRPAKNNRTKTKHSHSENTENHRQYEQAIASAKALTAPNNRVVTHKTYCPTTSSGANTVTTLPRNVSQGTKSGTDNAALTQEQPLATTAAINTSSEKANSAENNLKPAGETENIVATTEKTAPDNPNLKGETAVSNSDKIVADRNKNEAVIAVTDNSLSAEKPADAASQENENPEEAASKQIIGSESATAPVIAKDTNQTAFDTYSGGKPVIEEVGSTSMAKSAAATKTEEDYLEKEGGIWAQDTTGMTIVPPKDTTEIKSPNAIPLRSVEIFASPEFGFRTLSENGFANYTADRNKYESAGLGFSGGLHLTFGVTKKLGIKTGLQYTELREKLAYPATFPDGLQAAHSSYKYLTLPLHLVYEKRGYSNFTISVIAGPNVNMFLGSQCVVLNNDYVYELRKWGDSNHPFKPIAISGTAGIGLQYRVSKSVSIMLRPTVTYFPWSITKDVHQQKPYSFGAQTGIRFGF